MCLVACVADCVYRLRVLVAARGVDVNCQAALRQSSSAALGLPSGGVACNTHARALAVVLCCLVVCCVVLCCVALCCVVLCCAVWRCVVLSCVVLWRVVLCCVVSDCVVLRCVVPCGVVL